MKNSGSSVITTTRRAIRVFQFVEDSIIVLGVLFISLAILLQGVFRYLIRSMPLGLEEMAIIVASWVYFVGIGVAMRRDNHMVITIIDQVRLPETLRKVIFVFGDLVVVCISAAFAYYSISYTYHVHKMGTVILPFRISELYNIAPLAIGMVMATIYAAARFVRRLMEYFGSADARGDAG